jgi:hypothetical protein
MKSPTLPPTPAKTGRGRKRSGPVPALALQLGSVLTTLLVFVGSFGYASANLYVTSAPLQPAVSTTAADETSSTALTSSVRTTTRTAVTSTKSS